ncbi:MAG: phage holin family protein [Patescibacteria group bacterium]|nr:phage holin family protein [Patescibacteria group bacterium]
MWIFPARQAMDNSRNLNKKMKLLSKILFYCFSNLISLIAAAYFIKGFEMAGNFQNYFVVALLFTAINILIKPVLKLILSPIIILTLGLGIIAVNAVVLYLLDFFSENVSISGILPLIYATIFISLVNFFIHFIGKGFYKSD